MIDFVCTAVMAAAICQALAAAAMLGRIVWLLQMGKVWEAAACGILALVACVSAFGCWGFSGIVNEAADALYEVRERKLWRE